MQRGGGLHHGGLRVAGGAGPGSLAQRVAARPGLPSARPACWPRRLGRAAARTGRPRSIARGKWGCRPARAARLSAPPPARTGRTVHTATGLRRSAARAIIARRHAGARLPAGVRREGVNVAPSGPASGPATRIGVAVRAAASSSTAIFLPGIPQPAGGQHVALPQRDCWPGCKAGRYGSPRRAGRTRRRGADRRQRRGSGRSHASRAAALPAWRRRARRSRPALRRRAQRPTRSPCRNARSPPPVRPRRRWPGRARANGRWWHPACAARLARASDGSVQRAPVGRQPVQRQPGLNQVAPGDRRAAASGACAAAARPPPACIVGPLRPDPRPAPEL